MNYERLGIVPYQKIAKNCAQKLRSEVRKSGRLRASKINARARDGKNNAGGRTPFRALQKMPVLLDLAKFLQKTSGELN